MIWAVALAVFTLIACGVYLALSHDLIRIVIGFALVGNGINLLLFAAGRLGSDVPPVISKGVSMAREFANPLPQALVLTAIVISFALLCFSLVLVLRMREQGGIIDVSELCHAEPVPADELKPAIVEERAQ